VPPAVYLTASGSVASPVRVTVKETVAGPFSAAAGVALVALVADLTLERPAQQEHEVTSRRRKAG